MSITKNTFAKFTGTDETGTFSYVGLVTGTDSKAGTVTIQTDVGSMTVEASACTSAKRPKNAAKVVPATKTVSARTKGPVGSVRSAKKGTKAELVNAYVRENASMTRKELIAGVVESFGMTPAGASTYVSNARKVING